MADGNTLVTLPDFIVPFHPFTHSHRRGHHGPPVPGPWFPVPVPAL